MTVIFILMLMCVCASLIPFSFGALGFEGPTAGEFAANWSYMANMVAQMFIMLNTCWICTMDFGDKTANYELMTGHTRFEMFSARITASLITGILGFLMLFIVPTAVAAIIWEWGSCIYLHDMIFRWLLLIFPAARIIIETAIISFVIRKPQTAFVVVFMGDMLLNVGIQYSGVDSSNFILGMTNLNSLINVDSWATYGLNKIWLTFDPTLPASMIAGTIIVSLAASVLFFFIGYTFFRYDDID